MEVCCFKLCQGGVLCVCVCVVESDAKTFVWLWVYWRCLSMNTHRPVRVSGRL